MKKRIYTNIETILNNQLVAYTRQTAHEFGIKTSRKTKATLIAEINDKIRDERLLEKARQLVAYAFDFTTSDEHKQTYHIIDGYKCLFVDVYYHENKPYLAYIRFNGFDLVRYSQD